MKKVVVIMNTDRVGGAERSLLLQLISQKDYQYKFFIPEVSGSDQLEKLIKGYGFSEIKYYHYPRSIYNLSRGNSKFNLNLIAGLFDALFNNKDFNEVLSSDIVYLNGTKAAFLFFIKNNFLNFDKKVIWHFRDYWSETKFSRLLWSIFNNILPENLHIVCNSYSTLYSLNNSLWEKIQKTVVYNPSGLPQITRLSRPLKTIGFVSMLAPWKGIHEVILWAKMYEKELINLGVEKIKFFGADLYVTEGPHTGYAKQLTKLMEKLDSNLISFEGQVEPEVIFKNIDCLIHYSLQAEPFGRVLIEAFHHGVPVISTGLGGASELMENEVNGVISTKYDQHGLYMAIEKIATNSEFKNYITENAFKKSLEIEKNIDKKMHQVLKEVAV